MRHLFFLLLFFATWVKADNKIFSPAIKTLTAMVNDNWLDRPVMQLGTGDVLAVGFDELSHDARRYTCHLERC